MSRSGPLDVVVVEPWYGGSHRAWADGLVRHSRHRVRLVTHPDRFWRWRLRGGAVTLADQIRADVDTHGRPGVVVISSLVHGAALLGLARRTLGDVPVVAYVHESQLWYPTTDGRGPDTDAAMAKLLCTELLWETADQCLQLFGGYGYMREYPISLLYADSRVQRIYGGADEIMKEIVARSL